MKKTFLLFCSLITLLIHAQERPGIEQFIPTNSPEAMAFSQANFLPINEYTGKTNITIPLYEISFGGISVPIQLNYNYGGVQVNSVASIVGTNWSLTTGGAVVRELHGLNDYIYPSTVESGSLGSMMYPPTGTANCSWNGYQESAKDLYNVSAPGINTQFITLRPGSGERIAEGSEINKLGKVGSKN
ncbi:MAG: hypothetical protein PSN34_11155 [Urechidicola sp.]|nr:hypothetical protein [Urechidicola sp.]